MNMGMMRWFPRETEASEKAELDDLAEILAKGDVETVFTDTARGGMDSAAGIIFAMLKKSRWAP